MPEITFVFGPNNSFFFDCPKTWKFHGIPQTLRQLFNSSMGPAWRIIQPYCVALAPAVNTPEPVWYVGCKTMSGEDKLFHTQTFFEKNYPDLARWNKSFPNAPQLSFVTFGQNLAYFATARGRGSIYGGIPSELEDKVRKTMDNPTCVALGVKNAWFVLYPDGQLAWKFHGHYNGLNKILKTVDPRSISYVALSPYHKEHYFIAFHDKSIKYDFTGAPAEWMKLMTEVFDAWAAERMQKQAQPFFPPNPSPYHPQQQVYPQAPYMPPQPYSPTPSYLQTHPYPSPQFQQAQPYNQGRPQSFYNPNNPPPQELASYPMTGQTTPNSPLPLYTSPAFQAAAPVTAYGYSAPQGGAIEMPAELPGDAILAASAPAPVPVGSISTEKKKKFLSRIF